MAPDDWHLDFRSDQVQFLVGALTFIIEQADDRLCDVSNTMFIRFSAGHTKERAFEIREYVQQITDIR